MHTVLTIRDEIHGQKHIYKKRDIYKCLSGATIYTVFLRGLGRGRGAGARLEVRAGRADRRRPDAGSANPALFLRIPSRDVREDL